MTRRYGPVFERNARFSIKKPVPLLGNEHTPWEEVDAFYEFWLDFKSWREFPQNDEHKDLSKADSREEKRWMEQQNKKEREKAKKEDAKRLLRLVERAEKNDPRVKRHHEEEKKKKGAGKEAKLAAAKAEEEAKKKAKEEAKAAEEREKARQAEEAKALKEKKEAEKRQHRKMKSRFRTQAAAFLDANQIEIVCENLDMETITEVGDAIEKHTTDDARKATVLHAFEAAEAVVKGAAEELARKKHDEEEEKLRKEAEARAKKDTKPWAPEEVALLLEGYRKFPGGTLNRWKAISEHVKTRSEDECVVRAKEIQKEGTAAKAAVLNLKAKIQSN